MIRVAVAMLIVAPILWAVWASFQPVETTFAAPSTGGSDAGGGWRWDNYATALTRLPYGAPRAWRAGIANHDISRGSRCQFMSGPRTVEATRRSWLGSTAG